MNSNVVSCKDLPLLCWWTLAWLPSLRMLALKKNLVLFCGHLLFVLIFVGFRLDGALMSRLFDILLAMDIHFLPQKEKKRSRLAYGIESIVGTKSCKEGTTILSYVTMVIRKGHVKVFLNLGHLYNTIRLNSINNVKYHVCVLHSLEESLSITTGRCDLTVATHARKKHKKIFVVVHPEVLDND